MVMESAIHAVCYSEPAVASTLVNAVPTAESSMISSCVVSSASGT